MFLLPLTTLEGIECGKMFDKNGIQMLIPNKRFNFVPEKKIAVLGFKHLGFVSGAD